MKTRIPNLLSVSWYKHPQRREILLVGETRISGLKHILTNNYLENLIQRFKYLHVVSMEHSNVFLYRMEIPLFAVQFAFRRTSISDSRPHQPTYRMSSNKTMMTVYVLTYVTTQVAADTSEMTNLEFYHWPYWVTFSIIVWCKPTGSHSIHACDVPGMPKLKWPGNPRERVDSCVLRNVQVSRDICAAWHVKRVFLNRAEYLVYLRKAG